MLLWLVHVYYNNSCLFVENEEIESLQELQNDDVTSNEVRNYLVIMAFSTSIYTEFIINCVKWVYDGYKTLTMSSLLYVTVKLPDV